MGASEGLGRAMAEKIAAGGMDVVLVGHHLVDLETVSSDIRGQYGVDTLVVESDFSLSGAMEPVIEKTRGLDVGFMTYVACLHSFGKVQDTPWEMHQKMLNVNVNTFLACFYHFLGIFAGQDRGLIINFTSLTSITSSPYNAQYGACKAYIKKMTEASACEMRKTNVKIMCVTLGSTRTPNFLSNLPGGPIGERAIAHAMPIEDTVEEIFANVGKVRSYVVGERARGAVARYASETWDEAADEMGAYYEH